MRDRFVVRREGGYVGKNTGHSWQTDKPTYATVDLDHARLYFQKSGATLAAKAVDGTVIRAKLVLVDE
jgi:hypothetical protein